MKKMLIILVVLLFGLFLFGCTQQANPTNNNENPTDTNKPTDVNPPLGASTVEVTIQGFAFKPAEIKITPGTIVVWTNLDSMPHTVTGGELNSPTLAQGEKYSHTFSSVESIDYICTIHPSMKGKVTVQ